ncbi:SDR family oxidoreductase [Streptomyces rectiverticillatus]|uniref:SDR family oxidoreductase n=1 Tax=Streptomyces rectiverticillatus TaxID=173860 RepID=UPI0015C408E6|nr:SDR family oxidoreductase [Streptomyces rectiverticillatus]QLE70933.1 SDR family oxidoreductase [Streptomyces rectiverticillatus]
MGQPKRVALISGASRGIGAATAREMGRRGYHVVVNYRNSAGPAEAVVDAIEQDGGSAQAARADVCDGGQVADLVGKVYAEHGRIDALICNANTVNPSFLPFAEVAWEAFAEKINGELAGVFHLSQRVLAVMREQRSGRIVFISSTAADHIGMAVAHSTAKAALNTFSRHVAGVGAQYGVTVNTVAFGAVRTEASGGAFQEDLEKYLTDRSVLARLVEPEDAARTVALVADDHFGAATGQLIRVDGGFDVLDAQLGRLAGFFS